MLEKRNGWEVCRMTIQEKFAGLGIDNAPGQEHSKKRRPWTCGERSFWGPELTFPMGMWTLICHAREL